MCSKYSLDSDVVFCAKVMLFVFRLPFFTLAQCYYDNGEPRRCLSLLERKGMLSHQRIASIAEYVKPLQFSIVSVPPTDDILVSLKSVLLAAQCLFLLEQYDDCITLLSEVTVLDEGSSFIESNSLFKDAQGISPLSAVYCLLGKSLDILENRSKAVQAFLLSIQLDPACVESAKYIVQNSLMSDLELMDLYSRLDNSISDDRRWILAIYRDIFRLPKSEKEGSDSNDVTTAARSAEYFYQQGNVEESYRFSRHVFALDPYNTESIVTYIASMVELKQTTELFYLGHELVKSHPKQAVSWYAIGSYYWTINKCLVASKYLQKAVKVDKRFVFAWLMLGHTLSAQEESEHAISAYRSAVRLLPNDHRPAVYMARELLRSNYTPLALQVLLGCYESQPSDPLLLNEIGVAYLKVDKPQVAADFFEKAVFVARPVNNLASSLTSKSLESSVSYLCGL